MKTILHFLFATIITIMAVGMQSCSNTPSGLSVADNWQSITVDDAVCKYKLFQGTIDDKSGAYLEVIEMPNRQAALRIYDGKDALKEQAYFHVRLINDGLCITIHMLNKNGLLVNDPSMASDPINGDIYTWLKIWCNDKIKIDGYGNYRPGNAEEQHKGDRDITFKFDNVSLANFGE